MPGLPDWVARGATFEDPLLWSRLQERIVGHLADRIEAASRLAPSFETHCGLAGYIAALRWVLAEAAEVAKQNLPSVAGE